MYQNKRMVALITAAGSGQRMGREIPKQFIKLDGEMILTKALKAFENNNHIDDIYLVCRKEDMEFCVEEFAKKAGIKKLRAVISGGQERQDSVFNGLRVIKEEGKADYVLIHDGARPFVTNDEIDDLIKNVYLSKAATLGVVPTDSIARIESGFIKEHYDRNQFFLLGTPQAFELDLIYKAHINAKRDGFKGTDDTVLAKRVGHGISLVLGEKSNIKITTVSDLEKPEGTKSGKIRVGNGFDVHALVEGRKLILGGKEIDWEKGLEGHSDADVLTHGIMDAILGAAGLGDIGMHFPDSDPKYKDISSIKLLEQVKDKVLKENYKISSIDSVIVAQKPKLSPYFEEMKENISRALDISIDKINIKASSTENLGFCGREEGIAAMALATLQEEKLL